jgi:hypothetical protein
MAQQLSQLYDVFSRTIDAIHTFMDMLSPVISDAQDEHQRLYFHHIYEEEEHRLERLKELLPELSGFLASEQNVNSGSKRFSRLLQNINLEKFGLHNFLEHLDLAMYHFKDPEHIQMLTSMLEQTKADYTLVKDILAYMNEDPSISVSLESNKESHSHVVATTAHDDTNKNNIAPTAPTDSMLSLSPMQMRKGLSVGSLKQNR